MPRQTHSRFPKRFLWGAAVSAHQVEGGLHSNQWSHWEQNNAHSLAARSEYQFEDTPGWDRFRAQAKQPNNYISGQAAGHFSRYEADFDIAKRLNLDTLRFSIEWSRVEPNEGIWDADAINYYRNYVAELKKRGIEPIVTLFENTLPVWFCEMGAFEKSANVKYFVRFAEKIISELGIQVKFILTMAEPEAYAVESYLEGNWPPQKTSRITTMSVIRNLARAHRLSASSIRRLNRRYKVSVATNASYVYAGDDALLSRRSADVYQYFRDDYFVKKIIKSCDFIAINYYSSDRIYGYRVHNPGRHISDTGSDMAPENLEYVLVRLYEKYKLPIMITGNGLADSDDENRKWWLMETIVAMQKALASGVKLEGYLYSSLLDGFEWDKGFWPRTGLVAVDRSTLERTPRASAKWFGKVILRLKGDA